MAMFYKKSAAVHGFHYNHLGDAIKSERIRLDVSVDSVAAYCGMSVRRLYELEGRGVFAASFGMIYMLVKVVGMDKKTLRDAFAKDCLENFDEYSRGR